ncbi:MAG TPA: 50S ribosomal protein L4 [Candidatus Moranbacteria bacterium]|nr:50S ribosomal protein L4 [Candidatus Moranbacteria bacterium]
MFMAKLKVYNLSGEEKGVVEVSDEIFSCPANDRLLQQVYLAYAANRRQSTAHTKDRSERRGSGKKPWKQKGTGNARTGSVRNPVWRKGGVIFGPRAERNFTQKTTLKMRRKALALALSAKAAAGTIYVLENLDFPEKKTKCLAGALKSLSLEGKSCLLALSEAEKETALLGRNIPRFCGRNLETLNAYDLLQNAVLLISRDSLEKLQKRLLASLGEKTAPSEVSAATSKQAV